jgi:hypothetical protein
MKAHDNFSQQLLDEALLFLEEGGDDDAAFVLRTCEFLAGEDSSIYEPPYPVWVSLGCGRAVYDMLSQETHPLWILISRAIEAIAGGVPHISYHSVRMKLSPEAQGELTAISQKYAAYQSAAAKTASIQADAADEIDPTLCFVIMSFSKTPMLKEFYTKAVKPTVEQLGYRCERTDEQQFNGSILEQITRNIRLARFIIADLTEARPNCYYEMGFAHALGKTVIHIAAETTELHFDVKVLNFIVYSSAADLRKRLHERIEGTVGAAASTKD